MNGRYCNDVFNHGDNYLDTHRLWEGPARLFPATKHPYAVVLRITYQPCFPDRVNLQSPLHKRQTRKRRVSRAPPYRRDFSAETEVDALGSTHPHPRRSARPDLFCNARIQSKHTIWYGACRGVEPSMALADTVPRMALAGGGCS